MGPESKWAWQPPGGLGKMSRIQSSAKSWEKCNTENCPDHRMITWVQCWEKKFQKVKMKSHVLAR